MLLDVVILITVILLISTDTINPRLSWYNNSLVTTVWAGFDQPRSLGNREFGSSVALPIWLSFTKEIIDQIPLTTALPPEGLSVIKIDKSTGKRADIDTKSPIFEYFLEENPPN